LIDSSAMKSAELEKYLEASPTNKIILCGNVCMEQFKGSVPFVFSNDAVIIRKHPHQIEILKENYELKRIRGTSSGVYKRMINRKSSDLLQKSLMVSPNKMQNYSDANLKEAALNRLSYIQRDMVRLIDFYSNLEQELDPQDIQKIRCQEACSFRFWSQFLSLCYTMTLNLIETGPPPNTKPLLKQIHFTYQFRYSVFLMSHFLIWLKNGSQKNLSIKKLSNDMIDLEIGAISSFFDGLISRDKRLNEITQISRWLLFQIIHKKVYEFTPKA